MTQLSQRCLRRSLSPSLVMIGWLMTGPTVAIAQVTLDGTLGPAGPLSGPNYQIPAEVGQQRGGNLFHSFGRFTIYRGESATFSGPNAVANIIGRVTGGETSLIDGTLRSTIPNANLYLLNPAGIVFGENAQLDVQGSFHASTADYLRLGDTARFDARIPGNSLLSTAPPSAFGFLSEQPAPITVRGSSLEVPVGKSLSLIGGDIELTKALAISSNLFAPSGRITIASVASSGEVIPNNPDEPVGLKMKGFERLGHIRLTRRVFPDDSEKWVPNIVTDGNPGGTIIIRGGDLTINQGAIGSNSNSESSIDHPGIGIDIDVRRNIFLFGEISAVSYGTGRAGDIRIAANRLHLKGGQIPTQSGKGFLYLSNIGSRAFGAGDGGNIDITTNSLLVENNAQIGATAEATGSGAGGNLAIRTGDLQLLGDQGSAFIHTSTFGAGNAGNLTITADEILMRGGPGFTGLSTQAASTARGSASAGYLRLTARNIQVLDGAQVSAGVFSGAGDGGKIEISADTIVVDGTDADGSPAGIFSSSRLLDNSQEPTRGKAGDIRITAQALRLTDRATIRSSSTSSGPGGNISLSSDSLELKDGAYITSSGRFGLGTADSGNIDITTKSLSISGFDSTANPFGEDSTGIFTIAKDGRAGDIRITATNDFTLTSRGSISSSSFGSGRGGNIEIATRQLQVLSGSNILASAFGSGDGGAIRVTADEIKIAGVHPEPFTNLAGATSLAIPAIASQTWFNGGNAGKIQISAGRLQLLDGGSLASDTFGTGQGGHIDIKSNELLISGVSEVEKNFYIEQGLDPTAATRIAASSITAGADGSDLGEKATGNAGRITIQARNLLLQDNGRISTTTNSLGAGGDIELRSDTITLSRNASILARSEGKGNAGNISVTTRDHFRSENSTVATSANQAAGGNIEIRAPKLVTLIGSNITTSVLGGDQNAGNITIAKPAALTLVEGSRIEANTFGGRGGFVRIKAGAVVQSSDSAITADALSKVGIEGEVNIDSPAVNLTAGLVSLPATFFDATRILTTPCAERWSADVIRLTVRRYDTLPASPYGLRIAFPGTGIAPVAWPVPAAAANPAEIKNWLMAPAGECPNDG